MANEPRRDNIGRVDPLAPFVPGDRKRTPWSANVMNGILRFIRRSRIVRVGKGLKLVPSDYGSEIHLASNDDTTDPDQTGKAPLNQITGSGGGGETYICLARYS